ncbi:SPJ_0845 family protein [Secundilactobacillus kimchicus]|nr:SPJ_0845 family protein [Secundilactobacillus kimchicus]
MGLKFKREDDLNAEFGKFAELDLTDDKRDKFLKKGRSPRRNQESKRAN